MDPSDFPPLQQNSKPDTSLDSSWAEVAKEAPHQVSTEQEPTKPSKPSYAETAGHEEKLLETNPTPAEQVKGKLLNEHAPEFVPPNPSRSYADVSSHAGFPTLEESVEREAPLENDLSDLPPLTEMLDQPSAPKIPPPPPNASFAKIAAKSPPPEPEPPAPVPEEKPAQQEEKPTEPPSIHDKETFPSLESSTGGSSTTQDQPTNFGDSGFMGQSYVQVASQDLDQAPPAAQARVDSQPVFDENDMMAESARREKRKMKQMENSGQVEEITREMTTLSQQQTNVDMEVPKEERNRGVQEARGELLYKDRFTVFNTIATLHDNGYSWFTALATATLLHIRYSPCTSPYRFPLIYRSLTDLVTLPIYTQQLQGTLARLPILLQSRQQLDQVVAEDGHSEGDLEGLGLQDGFKALKKVETLRWWQVGLWASHRMQWTVSYMALQDSSAHLVAYSTLLAIKNVDDQV
ncbi:hypothetical protein [Absidia glauca]|uniref:Uncharacterized protein n=1 Tax=Absidia glauca TaxID=4829 RepID=A0A168MC72_ABSGL|nr:hypothetical protein [Absidia glauca]